LSPKIDSNLFESSDNLMINEHYYNPEINLPQSLPVVIKSGKLKPTSTYDIAKHIWYKLNEPKNEDIKTFYNMVVVRL